MLAIMLLFSACAPTPPTPTITPTLIPTPMPTLTPTIPPRPWRIMPMGDSLTEGAYPDGDHSYRGYLEALLRDAGYNFDFVGSQYKLAHGGTDYDHEGHGGFSIGPDESKISGWPGNIADNLERYLKHDPDVILLLIGINDMFPDANRPVNPQDAPAKLKNLVARILEIKPGVHIFLASLAPVGWTDGSDWPEYQAVTAMAEQIASADPADTITFVDLKRTLEPLMDKQTDFTDGLHFSESGARKVAQVWFDALQAAGLLQTAPNE